MKITKKTKIAEIIEKNPKVMDDLFKAGLTCIGCPMAMQETIEQGCRVHGMSKKEIEELIKKLNKEK